MYEIFGDVVVFDMMYRLSVVEMLFGIWVGVNNYGVFCFFGCVFLRDENVRFWLWVL